jgi:hypothetical protein
MISLMRGGECHLWLGARKRFGGVSSAEKPGAGCGADSVVLYCILSAACSRQQHCQSKKKDSKRSKSTYRLETPCSIKNGCQAMETNSYFWFGPLQMICSLGDGVDRCDEGVFAWHGGAFGRKVFGNGKRTFLHLSNVVRSGLLEMRRSHAKVAGKSRRTDRSTSHERPRACRTAKRGCSAKPYRVTKAS